MNKKYTKARFWKCALQVNPYDYLPSYRGQEHNLSEDEYNRQLLQICMEENIKILGIADHGNVNHIDAIRKIMQPSGVIVFPGFEMASSEKIHFVCLFSEETSIAELHRCLGSLELLDPEQGIRPSKLSAEQILLKVEDMGGFIYAAHCTEDKGLLKNRMDHVWKNPLLKATQIPITIEELEGVENDFYRKVILNKNKDYQRETPIAVINAKDIESPKTLENPSASCLIKMTTPCFNSFKLAFQDPESRVRLNSDVLDKYYSHIKLLKITSGYLDGVRIDFSKHLNSVIGGRGTGKSTLLECIRYALGLEPIGKNAQNQHQDIIKENIGKSRARIELTIRSSAMNGKKYTIARRYGENASVKDEEGNISSLTPQDILPKIEIYGQNEIYEIAQDEKSQKKLLSRFLEIDHGKSENKIKESLSKLRQNRETLCKALDEKASVESELGKLPKLEERIKQFKTLGIEEKLKIIPLLENEKQLKKRIDEEEIRNLEQAFFNIKDVLPDTVFLSDKVLEKLPHAELLKKIKVELDKLKIDGEKVLAWWQRSFSVSKKKIETLSSELQQQIKSEESNLEKTFKGLPASEGKSGREIGIEYQQLLQDIEKIKPQKALLDRQKNLIRKLEEDRDMLLAGLSEYRSERTAKFESSLKKLNRKLKDKLQLTINPEANRQPVIDFLVSCNLEGVASGRLQWINNADDFSPVKLAKLILDGEEALAEADWGITSTGTNALAKMNYSKILALQELELPDIIEIKLNVAHEGEAKYRPLNKLSTGQQCTAILHFLLLQNKEPLIMDQPEDNLDNAFIADRIVAGLRNAKLNRQFIFATHNANIPVFGDAEWIGVLEFSEGQGVMPEEVQGGIDMEIVREKAAGILEGGRTAFNQRKLKYGY